MQIHGGNWLDLIEKYQFAAREITDFSSNINPWGPPQSALQAIQTGSEEISRYPDLKAQNLKAVLSQYLGVSSNHITLGNGSSELIYLLPVAMKIQKALIIAPTFIEYQRAIVKHKGQAINHIIDVEVHKPDLSIISSLSKFDAVFLCNPNNPTGYLYEKQDLLFLAKKALADQAFLIVDEAFIDFVEEREYFTLAKEAIKATNVLVLGSLGKFFSLAGLRIGYLIANQENSKRIAQIVSPWNVNSLAQIAATAALQDEDFVRQSRLKIKRERDFLSKNIAKLPFLKCYPSSANFILVKITTKSFDAAMLGEYLASKAILIRQANNFAGLNNSFFRLAVLDRKSNLKLLTEIEKFINERGKNEKN